MQLTSGRPHRAAVPPPYQPDFVLRFPVTEHRHWNPQVMKRRTQCGEPPAPIFMHIYNSIPLEAEKLVKIAFAELQVKFMASLLKKIIVTRKFRGTF